VTAAVFKNPRRDALRSLSCGSGSLFIHVLLPIRTPHERNVSALATALRDPHLPSSDRQAAVVRVDAVHKTKKPLESRDSKGA
jgi:hypothetical protein